MPRLASLVALGLLVASPAVAAPSFRHDVEPVLTRYGCNQGACHGKNAGQNGFRLSLRGYAPDWDHDWIAREFAGRRIDRVDPDRSLMLLKPAGGVVHGGGKLFGRDSDAYRTLRDWIAAGCLGPDPTESAPTGIEVAVVGGNAILKPGDGRRIKVTAAFADGSTRDVTWLTQFFSNDESVVAVTPDGSATGLRPGETSVRAHYSGFVRPVALTLPYAHAVDPARYAERRNVVDEHVFNKLAALNLPHADDCGDAAFVRRVHLDAVGRPPMPSEVRDFLADVSPDKRQRLIDALLASSDFIDYWTLQLADVFQNRRELDHDVRGIKGVRSFHRWLRGQVAANRGWDAIARDVLIAAGDADENPAVGYFVVTVGEHRRAEESEAGSAVAQSLLGVRIGCAKCHNHPLEKYTQDDYYRFNAFFAKVAFDRKSDKQESTVLSVAGPDERDKSRRVSDLETKLAEADAKAAAGNADAAKRKDELVQELDRARRERDDAAAKPALVRQPRTGEMLGPQPLDRSGIACPPGSDPRAALADWMTRPDNEHFAGAMVNRLWKHCFAVGLVEPVDDLRASNPPSNGPLWNALNHEFIESGYDLRHVLRLILNSRAYQLSSETSPENAADGRFYSHYYARRLPAEALLDAVCAATGVPSTFTGYPVGLRAVQVADPWAESYFLEQFGRPRRATACACERVGEVSLPQLLHLRNAAEIDAKLGDPAGTAATLAAAELDDAKLADEAFLATLARLPNDAERRAVVAALQDAADRPAAMRDLFWALLNTQEFAFNH